MDFFFFLFPESDKTGISEVQSSVIMDIFIKVD